MKKTLALVLSALMIAACFTMFAFSASADEAFTWDPETCTITVLQDVDGSFNSSTGEDTYPWAEYRQDVVKVVVADNVTKLGHAAFSSAALLEEVICGKKCATIDMDAFAYNASLTNLVFKCPVTSIGQGTVWQTTNLMSVTTTNQTREEFLKIAKKRNYNDQYEDEFISWTEATDPTLTPEPKPEYITISISPYYGCIENWNGNTYFIVGGTDSEYSNRDKLAPVDEEGNRLEAPEKLKVVIVDETEGKTYTISEYKFDNPGAEIYGDGSFLRIAACFYGIPVVGGHKYTVSLEFTENGKVIAKGTSAKGAFDHGNEDFTANGQIIPDPVPHSYDEAQGGEKPPVVNPPETGDNTAVIAVLAIVAVLGTAVVVSKKVLSK